LTTRHAFDCRNFKTAARVAALALGCCGALFAPAAATAESHIAASLGLPAPGQQPEGDVLLSVTITDSANTDAKHARYLFDRTALEVLPKDSFETSTIWTEGLQRFEGVRLHALVQELGISDGTLWLTAINDYMVEMPVSELRADGALLAHTRNGAPMTARDKGPLWVVFPYDENPRWQTETVYARSIWQLDRIEVER